MSKSEVHLIAVGDIAPDREVPGTLFDLIREDIRKHDVAFCQLEINLTERGSRLPQVRHTSRASPGVAKDIREAGFNVVSFAGNHCMDWGQEGFFDTIAALRGEQLAVVGVGANIVEARKVVTVDAKGNRIAFIAANSILPMSYWAEANRPGCMPMRAWTIYEQIEHDQPGTPSRIHTFANREDLGALVDCIRQARAEADVVMVSLHWGIHFVPATLADYQRDVAYAAIDAGADVILGHHAHILKGVELYRGKPIFYSLCNFAMDLPVDEHHAESKGFKEIQKLNPDWKLDPKHTYNFPTDSQKSLAVKCVIADGKIRRLSLLPVFINRQSQPRLLSRQDPEFEQVVRYLEAISDDQKLGTKFVRDGDEVLLESA